MARFSRRSFLQATGLGATALTTSIGMPAIIRSAHAAGGTVKLGCLFSSSGTMANIEGRLNHVVRMAADEINAMGGVNGRTIEVAVSDPASDWPLYAQVSKQMLEQDKVAALFGCWTSVSRKTVLPVVEQANGLLFYPLHFEGDENSKNVTELAARQFGVPAVDYLMSEEGVSAKRFFMLGSDYVWPRTINKRSRGTGIQGHRGNRLAGRICSLGLFELSNPREPDSRLRRQAGRQADRGPHRGGLVDPGLPA
jgi:urea transport system substrate-binding protein